MDRRIPRSAPPQAQEALAGDGVTVIGRVAAGEGVWLDGQPLTPRGWDHLARTE